MVILFLLLMWFGIPAIIVLAIVCCSSAAQDNQAPTVTNDINFSYKAEEQSGMISEAESCKYSFESEEDIEKKEEEFLKEIESVLSEKQSSNYHSSFGSSRDMVTRIGGSLSGGSKPNESRTKNCADDAFDNAILESLKHYNTNNQETRQKSYSNSSTGDRDYNIKSQYSKIEKQKSVIEKSEICDIYHIAQRTTQWHSLRKGKVTGSDAYYLKNNSVSAAISRALYRDEYPFQNEAMRRGIELEPIGIEKFSKKFNKKVETVGFLQSNKYAKAGFSPDGIIRGTDGKIKAIVEHKAYNKSRHLDCYGKVFADIIYQMQYGMFVSGAKEAYLILYNPDIYDDNFELLVKVMPRDPNIQEMFRNRFDEYEAGKHWLTSKSIRMPYYNKDTSFALH